MIWSSEERRQWLSQETTGSKSLLATEIDSCLGDIHFAGYIRRSYGVIGPKWRVYGKYALAYIIEGGGIYRDILGFRKALNPGDLIFVFPELGHVYRPRKGESWTEIYIVFSGPVFDMLREARILNTHAPVVPIGSGEEWLDRFEELLSAGSRETRADRVATVSRLVELIAEVAQVEAGQDDTLEARWLQDAKMLIESRLDRPLVLRDLARDVGLSYDNFRKSFRQAVGLTPGQYHAARRIEASCSLLRFTQMNLAQIAANLGFVDEYHFSKRFHTIKGMRPAAYRKTTE